MRINMTLYEFLLFRGATDFEAELIVEKFFSGQKLPPKVAEVVQEFYCIYS